MKLILDTTSISEVKEVVSLNLCDGFNVNPINFLKESKDIFTFIKDLSVITDLPMFIDVFLEDAALAIENIKKIRKISQNVCFRLPFTILNLKLCKELVDQGMIIEISYCTSTSQAILSYKSGASYVSVVLSLIDDFSIPGIDIIKDIKEIYDNYPECQTEIKAFGIKNASDVVNCMKLGIESCVISNRILNYMLSNPMGDSVIKKYNTEYKKCLH